MSQGCDHGNVRGPEALTLAGLADSTLVSERTRVFPADFNRRVDLQPQGSEAFFGLDVLDGLVSGIADFVALRQPRWARYRSVGPALLASTLWLDDPKVIAHLGSLSSACVVITKQPRPKAARDKLAALRECNKNAPGFPARAFSALTELAPLVDGRPQVIGPMSAMPDLIIPTVRTLGFRKAATGDSHRCCTPSWRCSDTCGGTTRTAPAVLRTSWGSSRSDCGSPRPTSPRVRAEASSSGFGPRTRS